MTQTRLTFLSTLPPVRYFGEDALLICDRKLLNVIPGLKNWTKRFRALYFVVAGEELKSLHRFPFHLEGILNASKDLNPRKMVVVALGGGSVGDFAGFVASVFKRGVRLVHIPTTWLAAMDSSHGGKTALNVQNGKNQVGTFYASEETILVRNILISQPHSRALEASGELVKIAILSGEDWVLKLERARSLTAPILWKYLPKAIQAKLKIVAKDPRETTNVRQTLNLGHTLGHVLETALKLPHGIAVAHGLKFSIHWSLRRGLLTKPSFLRAINLIGKGNGFMPVQNGRGPKPELPSQAQFESLLVHDKKREDPNKLNFIFVSDFGKPLCSLVTIDELVAEASHQGFIRK